MIIHHLSHGRCDTTRRRLIRTIHIIWFCLIPLGFDQRGHGRMCSNSSTRSVGTNSCIMISLQQSLHGRRRRLCIIRGVLSVSQNSRQFIIRAYHHIAILAIKQIDTGISPISHPGNRTSQIIIHTTGKGMPAKHEITCYLTSLLLINRSCNCRKQSQQQQQRCQ